MMNRLSYPLILTDKRDRQSFLFVKGLSLNYVLPWKGPPNFEVLHVRINC